MFGRLPNLRRMHTRHDHRADTIMAATTLAAIVLFWRLRDEA